MQSNQSVTVRMENITIPTYQAHLPEKNPLFMERRAYQGSTGRVYPLPVIERISDEKQDVTYRAVILENEYLYVMILPDIGGRIHRAYDKTNQYDFVYFNHVIKPALVGLTGPWISGGIEFNWPQHHRPSTFMPVDFHYTENPDGSCSVFVGETDRMYGTKGMAEIKLVPGRAYIEIRGQLYNPTDVAQTFLWWANPAVPVNEHTYSVFPPDVNAVMDHGKRAVSTFPVATGEYYKYDYSAGVDISRYRNVKVPTSYMAAHSDFDFIGNYDEDRGAGLLHVADHHISPGKKQWTWGCGDFGRTWDRNLTDGDGPYIELMTGVFTDNQPDFTWLKPHEEKRFVQYFLPYKGVGRVGNATREAIVGWEVLEDGRATVRVYATAAHPQVSITVEAQGAVLYEKKTALGPEAHFEETMDTGGKARDCLITVVAGDRCLVRYQAYTPQPAPVPDALEPLPAPSDLKSTEELYLAALHLEQYRHATYDPADYYHEGLRRDPTDMRLNDGYGLLLMRRGQVEECLPYFQAAIRKQTWRNPNPYHGECYYHYGLALEALGQDDPAYDAFYKATWNAESQSAGFYWLACLEARKGRHPQALAFVERALAQSARSMKARALKAAVLRHMGREAGQWITDSLALDPLDMGSLYEAWVVGQDASWPEKMRGSAHNHLTLALQYMQAGLYGDALHILEACGQAHPMIQYAAGWAYDRAGDTTRARACYQKAEEICPDWCFPSRIEEERILLGAIHALGHAPMAEYYLGNLRYDKKQYEAATRHWENAAEQKPDFPMPFRNLSIAYYNKQNDDEKALAAMERACALQPDAPRFWLERDQLMAKMHFTASERLEVLQQRLDLVAERDDLYLRYVTLQNSTGRHAQALECLMQRRFHPWEGGEGKVSAQYRFALIRLAKQAISRGEESEAIGLLRRSLHYPENLGEGKLPNVPDNEAYYWMGVAYRQSKQEAKATECFETATLGEGKPSPVLYYNDQPSDYIYYQGLAHLALGQRDAAKKAFNQLIAYGERHVFDKVEEDFFAVSLPEIEVYRDDIARRHREYCNRLRALGKLGQERIRKEFG